MTFFTADTHFGHENIIRLCNRPFGSIEEMDETLILNWNSVVGIQDTIYFLGDFSHKSRKPFKFYLDQLNGIKHIVLGNHDKKPTTYTDYFESVSDLKFIEVEGQDIVLCHYPMLSWKKKSRGAWHLYGHVHTANLSAHSSAYAYNVGVDTNNFTPISLEELNKHFEKIQNVNLIP